MWEENRVTLLCAVIAETFRWCKSPPGKIALNTIRNGLSVEQVMDEITVEPDY